MLPYYLPGQGDAKPDCGTVQGWIYSECAHKVRKPIIKSCDRWECPICHDKAARRAATRIEAQWMGKVAAYRNEWGALPTAPQHFTWSHACDQRYDASKHLSARWVARYRNAAIAAMKRHSIGLFGGVVVVHPWRKKHDDGSHCESRECEKAHVWDWGPHVHFIGWGRFENPRKLTGSGWVYRHIEDRGQRDIWATAYYQLTHGAIIPGKQAYAWVGLMSNGHVRLVRKVSRWDAQVCPDCGEPLFTDKIDPESGLLVPFMCMRKLTEYYYKIPQRNHKTHKKLKKRWF